MSAFVSNLLSTSSLEEETFGPLEATSLRQEGLQIVNDAQTAIDRFESILESAQSLESLQSLAKDNPHSLESLSVPFSVASSGYLKDDLSLEGISSFIKKVWDAIVKAWKKVKEMIGKLVNWILGRGGKQQKKSIDDLKAETDLMIKAHKNNLVETQRRLETSLSGCDEMTKAVDKLHSDLLKDPDFEAFDEKYGEMIEEIFKDLDTSKEKDVGDIVESTVADRSKELANVAATNRELATSMKKVTESRENLKKTIEKKLKDSDPDNESDLAKKLRKAFGGELSKPARVMQESTKEIASEISKMEKAKKEKEKKKG